MEHWIASAEVIDVTKHVGDRVVFGATVSLEDIRLGRRGDATGSSASSRPTSSVGSISVTSPIARALIGREEGDTVTVRTPGGEKEYEIQSISFVEEELPGESGE